MSLLFPTVALIGKYHDDQGIQPLLTVAQTLTITGREVLIERQTAHNMSISHYAIRSLQEIGEQADLAVVMGGDGTMLGVARELASYDIALVGINSGRVGFITDVPLSEAAEGLNDILQGHYVSERRSLITGKVIRGDQVLLEGLALNDVVLSRSGAAGMIEFDVSVDQYHMYKQRADGLIIATPTGSTAYALSANGPILHPALRGIVMVPVAPHALSNRPITLPDDSEIEIRLSYCSAPKEHSASVHFDMQSWASLAVDDRILVKKSQYTSHFLHPAGYSYFATLRRKLHWSHNPDYDNEKL